MSVRVTVEEVDWPLPVAIEETRVLSGSPEASTLVLHDDGNTQLGMWRVTKGEFSTRHVGYVEAVTILRGRGRLISEAGEPTELAPGVVAVLESGWSGRWVVEETIIKSYAVLNDR